MTENGVQPNGNSRDYEEWRYRDVKADIEELKTWTRAELVSISTKLDAIKDGTKPDAWKWALGIVSMVGFIYLAVDKEATLVSNPLAGDLKVAQRDIERLVAWQIDAERELQANVGDDRASVKDREAKGADIAALQEAVSRIRVGMAAVAQRQCENETQFAADENLREVLEGFNQRWTGIFARKLLGYPLPQLAARPPGLATGKPCIPVTGG